MKKIILAAFASAVFALGAMAQSRPGIIVSAGYQGANISNINDAKVASGARAGVAVDFGVLDAGNMMLSIQPGLNFSMKGVRMTEDSDSGKLNTYYLDLPILANLRFDGGNGLGAFVNAGPYIAYGIGGNLKLGSLKIEENPFKKVDGESFLNAFDWGLQVGAGVEYNRMMLTVGTQVGMYDITPKVNGVEDIFGEKTNKNTSFFVTVGYRF